MNNIAIIVASGIGSRMGLEMPKQFVDFFDEPVFMHSFKSFAQSKLFNKIIIVANKEWHDFIYNHLKDYNNFLICEGGATRANSVYNGMIIANQFSPDYVFIHDAARPKIEDNILESILQNLKNGADGVIPVLSVSDALWQADSDGNLLQTVDKTGKLRAQTPQAFNYQKLLKAYQSCDFSEALDDAQIAVNNGMNVTSIRGSQYSDKLTFKEDFIRMEKLLNNQAKLNFLPRVGIGYDVHRFCEGEFVTLCGIKIPHTQGLEGHSDADVAWHALTDALLGAIALGDIGKAFPPSEPKWKGAPSSIFLKYAKDECTRLNAIIANVDITIICESPKVGKYREELQKATAQLLEIPIDRVGIKATTTEKLGFTGRKEGIAAQAVASLIQTI